MGKSELHPISLILEGFLLKNEAWVQEGAPCSQSALPLVAVGLYELRPMHCIRSSIVAVGIVQTKTNGSTIVAIDTWL